MKRTLQTHKSVFLLSGVNHKIKLEVSDDRVTDTAEVATMFNNSFSCVEHNLNENIPSLPDAQKANVKVTCMSFVFLNTDEDESYSQKTFP